MNTAYSILIVDDEVNLRSTLGVILQRAGYGISEASDGQDALQLLSNNKYDMMFLDLKMPGIDGLQLLPESLRIDPDLSVVILTANASLETAIRALSLGAEGYLLKPVDPDQILSRVKEIFRDREQIRRRKELVLEINQILADLNQVGD